MEMLIDCSAVMAFVTEEAEKAAVLKMTKNSILIAPNVLDYEIGNALSKLYKRGLIDKSNTVSLFLIYKSLPINLIGVNINNSIDIFTKYTIYAYDAYYLDVASRLELPILTFDKTMKTVAMDMGLRVMEDTNESF
ncbi:twitching motility protein PilT [Spirochaetia bacterium]|nr:twitching motility protein PilT [Spirochaetia bacterium]